MNRRWPIAIFLLSHSLVGLSGEIQVKINLEPKSSWSEADRTLIEDAATKTFRRLAKAKVANCGYRYTSKEDKDEVRKIWGNRMPVINKSRSVTITIHKKSLGHKTLGQARVGIARIDWNTYRIENLEIDLSKEALHSHLNSQTILTKKDLWVNVIAHEVAHNLGFSHGRGKRWSTDYPGYFATEIGFCAMTDGLHGSFKRY